MPINYEAAKTLIKGLVQKMKSFRGNWEQNDPTADDYIKNRPFYTGDLVEPVLVEEVTVPFVNAEGLYMAEFPSTFEATVGDTYTVTWDGIAYECTCVDFDDLIIGNLSIINSGSDTGEPFVMGVVNGFRIVIATKDTSASHTFSISGLVQEVVKLDKKYIPDLDLAPVAKSGDYYDLNNRPAVYGDVVRYSNQSLTPVQKNVARNNIGAASASNVYNDVIRYSVNQSLTTNQKSVARNNIGAGTSNFSGNYNDLANKPTIVQGDWEVNNDSDMAYIKNRTHYDYTKYTSITFSNSYRPVASSLINDIYYYGEKTGGSLNITAGDIYKVTCSNSTAYISTCQYVPIPGLVIGYAGRVLGNARLGVDAGYLNGTDSNYPITDTGEPWCFISYQHTAKNAIISTIPNFKINSLYIQSDHELKQLDEKYIPSTIQRVGDDLIVSSSTFDSDKKFKITVDDSGKPTFTNSSDSADSYTPTDLPPVTASDSGKFLRVINGEAAWSIVPNAEEANF